MINMKKMPPLQELQKTCLRNLFIRRIGLVVVVVIKERNFCSYINEFRG